MFGDLIASGNESVSTSKKVSVALSVVVQSVFLGLLLLAPLIYTEALPARMLQMVLLVPPVPARPTPPPAELQTNSRQRMAAPRPIMAPPRIPTRIVTGASDVPVEFASAGPEDPVGGDLLLNTLRSEPSAPPPAPEHRVTRIPVGGNVEAALLISRVMPQYPPIAVAAHVSGTVELHAIIAKDGSVQELSYISGPMLLIRAALDAVHQWKYRPTLLNGEPVEIETTIDVVFSLNQ